MHVPTARWYELFCNCCDELIGTYEDGVRAREALREAKAAGRDVSLFASTAYGEFEVE